MEDFSLNALMAMAAANKAITGAIISTLLSVMLIKLYWEEVSYFVMRVWHGIPLIGTVARLSRSGMTLDSSEWLHSEAAICSPYYKRYVTIGGETNDYYNKCEAYLDAVGEGDRRERPLWVLVLVFLLILFEAVGFAYVLVPFINQNLSSNDQAYLGWIAAFLLSILSAGLAEAAGRAIHRNSLVKKARHWWEIDADKGSAPLKQILPGYRIKDTDKDEGAKDYNRILARMSTNQTVTPRNGWIIACVAVVVFIACAAFGVRAYQLKSIETEMVGNPNVFAEQSYESSASPFELPADSASVNQEAKDKTLEDKMDAIRSASLITFVVLSVIYVAIQAVSVWMASLFGFAGSESRKAWRYTHKFNNSEELENWMDIRRTSITSDADHKLRMLQLKLSQRPTTDRKIQDAISGAHGRDFSAFVVRKTQESVNKGHAINAAKSQPAPQPAAPVQPAPAAAVVPPVAVAPAPAPAPVAVAEPAPAPAPAPAPQPAVVAEPAPAVAQPAAPAPAGGLDAMRAMDLTRFSEDELRRVAEKKGLAPEDVLKIRADQLLMKEFEGI